MIGHSNNIQALKVTHPDAHLAHMKALIGPPEGWDSHVLRVVEVAANGYTMKHQHPWPHINYVLSGNGIVMIDGVDHPVKAGSIAYIPADTIHQFSASSTQDLSFICIVPKDGHTY